MRFSIPGLSALVLGVLLTPAVFAEVKTRDITFKSGDEEIKGFLAEPDGKGPYPAIVCIQEWWGLADWIKENAKQLAGQGYVVLAPDLYRGKVTDDRAVAAQLRKALPRDRALRDLKATIDALSMLPNVDKTKIGSIGWCMGGEYSLQLALQDPRVTACAMCYGAVVPDPKALAPLRAKVLGIFGENDMGIPAAQVRKFETALREAKKQVDKVKIYEGAGHGFMRPRNGASPNPEYREAAAKDAWNQVEQFFAATLKGKS